MDMVSLNDRPILDILQWQIWHSAAGVDRLVDWRAVRRKNMGVDGYVDGGLDR